MNANFQSHTPAPWVKEGWTVVADRKTNKLRAMIAACAEAPMIESQWEANARLIAKAPEMYNILKDIANVYAGFDGDETNYPGWMDEVRGLIAEMEKTS